MSYTELSVEECATSKITTVSPDTFLDGQPGAIAGVSQTACGATLISGLVWLRINETQHGGIMLPTSTAKTGAPPGFPVGFRNATLRSPYPDQDAWKKAILVNRLMRQN